MTVSQVLLAGAVCVLAVSAALVLWRLAKGPTGLDRGVAADVMIAILIAAVGVHAVWQETSIGLVLILVLSLMGFMGAVGLARLITGTSARERRYREAQRRPASDDRGRRSREEWPEAAAARQPREDGQ